MLDSMTPAIIICTGSLGLALLLGSKKPSQLSFSSAFECGPSSRLNNLEFSHQFFSFLVIFLIFDLELTSLVLLPDLLTGQFFSLPASLFLFVVVLGVVFAVEFLKGSLVWA